MPRNIIQFASVAFVFGASSLVMGCQGATDAPSGCTSAAECAADQACNSGQCVAKSSQGAAGSAGKGSSGGAGPGGATGAAGGQVYAGGGGSFTTGGSSSSGGSNSGGGSSTGGSNTGGSNTGGSNIGGSSTGGSNTGGSNTGGSNTGGSNTGGSSGGGMSGGPGDVAGKCKDDYLPATSSGSVTRYDFVQGTQLPACGYKITHTGAGKDGDWDTVEGVSTGSNGYFGAMNTTDYNKGAACGACVEVTYNGSQKVVVTIVDECPVSSNSLCVKGHIDLSRKAIRQLQPNASLEHLGNGGNGSISWRYLTCPAVGNAMARLHPSQTANWQPVVIENGLYPLDKVTINGVSAARVGNNSGGNAWLANAQKLPYAVRATDVNGDAVQFSFSGGTNLLDTGKQFMCSK